MTSIDSIVAQLQRALDHLHQTVGHVRGARDMAEELRDLFEQLGTHDLVERMHAVIDRAEELLAMLLAGIDAGEQLIAQTEAVRHGEPVRVTGPAAPPPMSQKPERPRPAAKAPVTPEWRRRFLGEVPEHVRVAGARLRPRAPGERRFTSAVLDGEMIYSGREGKSSADDLDHSPLAGLPTVFDRHVESKVAARMRAAAREQPETPPRAEVVIDNTVCGTNERDRDSPWTCHKVLPSILPRHSTLVVWTTCDGGRTFWRHAYHGTGERIRR